MSESFSPTEPVPDDLIASNDAERPSAELVAAIRERLADSEQTDPGPLADFPRFGGPIEPGTTAHPAEQHLARAAALLAEAQTAPHLAPSAATRMPLLGPLWRRVRRQAHELVLFYVNRQAAQTTKVQHHLLAAIQALTAESDQQRERIAHLEKALADRPDTPRDTEQ
jgi:hypothetical protein